MTPRKLYTVVLRTFVIHPSTWDILSLVERGTRRICVWFPTCVINLINELNASRYALLHRCNRRKRLHTKRYVLDGCLECHLCMKLRWFPRWPQMSYIPALEDRWILHLQRNITLNFYQIDSCWKGSKVSELIIRCSKGRKSAGDVCCLILNAAL